MVSQVQPTPLSLQEILQQLPARWTQTSSICPLCGGDTHVKGLRSQEGRWEVLLVCVECGLVTAFNAYNIDLEVIKAMQGSAWAAELRTFAAVAKAEEREPLPTPRHISSTFCVCFCLWLLLTGSFAPVDLVWGAVVSISVAAFSYRFSSFDLPLGWVLSPRRWLALILLILEFTRQLIIQNVTLSFRVLRPKMSIKPGIVAIPTRLRDDASLTLLGSLMSLTPDTVTLDIDQNNGMIYVHWIDVQTTDPTEAQRLIASSLEDKIVVWLGKDQP